LHNRSLPHWQDTRTLKGTLPLRLHRNSPENSPKGINEEIELAPDLINISQINFDTNPDDFSMTNNLFAEKPTSRFMDRDEIQEYQMHQREFNKSSSRKGSSGHGEVPLYYTKGRNELSQHNNSKNWIIREEDSYYKGGDNSMRMPELDLIKTINENLFTKILQSDNEKSKLLEFVERLVFEKKDSSERDSSTKNSLERQEKELMTMRETCQREKEQ